MITNSMMQRGKIGLFGSIEYSSNLISSQLFFALQVLLTCLSLVMYFTIEELLAGFYFVVLSVLLLLVSIVEMTIVKRKEGKGKKDVGTRARTIQTPRTVALSVARMSAV